MNMNTDPIDTTNTTDNNTSITKTGNASFDAGVELGAKIGYKQGIKDSFDTNQFTQEELQFLKATISKTITVLHDQQALQHGAIGRAFIKCNPEDSSTYKYFKYLNVLRDVQRGYSADIKKLAGIQKKIKSSLRK